MTDFNPSDIENLKNILPCNAAGKTMQDHEQRLRLLEEINARLSQLVMGAEGESILKRLERLEGKFGELKQTVGFQKWFGSGFFKILLVVIGGTTGALLTFWLL